MEQVNDKGISLSELPDDVLSHILSLLSTEKAIQTSILSKRWEYLWTSIPELHFDTFETEVPMDFMNIVDRSLRLRGSCDITRFTLHFENFEFSMGREDLDIMSQVEVWISDLVRFNVQDVDLYLYGDSTLTLPFNFVNCTTLTRLTIYAIGFTLKFPSPVCFSNLKKLELCNVILPDEHSTQKLFSGCPLLEDLKLQLCNWDSVKAVSVLSPRLKHFIMIEDSMRLEPKTFNGNEFVIFGYGLKYFHYEGELQFDVNILNPQLLEAVHINFFSPENALIPVVIDRFLKFLRYASDVPNLSLMNALRLDIPEVLIQMPMFKGVRHLKLDYNSSDLSNIGLLMMLRNIPHLKSLEFWEGIKKPSDPDGILDPFPPCFLNRLRFVSVFIKKGDVNDLVGVEVVLGKAVVLVKMTIEFSIVVNEDTKHKFCLELLKLPRASRACGIHIKH